MGALIYYSDVNSNYCHTQAHRGNVLLLHNKIIIYNQFIILLRIFVVAYGIHFMNILKLLLYGSCLFITLSYNQFCWHAPMNDILFMFTVFVV